MPYAAMRYYGHIMRSSDGDALKRLQAMTAEQVYDFYESGPDAEARLYGSAVLRNFYFDYIIQSGGSNQASMIGGLPPEQLTRFFGFSDAARTAIMANSSTKSAFFTHIRTSGELGPLGAFLTPEQLLEFARSHKSALKALVGSSLRETFFAALEQGDDKTATFLLKKMPDSVLLQYVDSGTGRESQVQGIAPLKKRLDKLRNLSLIHI